MSLDSPCIGVCELAEGGDFCAGCHRTLSEIAAWPGLSEPEQFRVLTATRARREAHRGETAQPQRPPVPRIVSLLPAATEMAYALGLGENLVGVTHECDFPASARDKPVVVRPALALENMGPREVDAAVSRRRRESQSLYHVDEKLLRELRPDILLTQDLCQVCAPSGRELALAWRDLQPKPLIISMSPRSIGEIHENLRALGKATDRNAEAETCIRAGRARLEKIAARAQNLTHRPRVFFMEWADPVYCAGHWVPEMVELAGGVDALARKHTDSGRVSWQSVVDWAPEILIFSPCGFNLEQSLRQLPHLESQPGWANLPAVRNRRVYAVDANSYFARPGPRVVEGTELLAHLIHPHLFSWDGPADAFCAMA
jgi:iron complex transport system substrate-binding protein